MIELGDIAKDDISGFKGTVVAITRWYNGCDRYLIQPNECGKDGKPIEAVCFDVQQLSLVKPKAHKPVTKTGGPRPDPTRW